MLKWRSMLVGGAISAICLYLVLRKVDLTRTGEAFAAADPRWLAAAVGLTLAAVVVRCVRWQLLFRPSNRVSFGGAFTSTMVGYLFITVLPGRVGELVRASLVAQTERVSAVRAIGTIFVEKILDILVLLIGLGVLTVFLPLPAWITNSAVIASVAFGAVAVAFFVLSLSRLRGAFAGWVERTLDRLPVVGRLQPSRIVDVALGSADALRYPHLLLATVALSLVLWALALLTVWSVIRAFHLDVPWTAPALALITTNLGMTVPSAPASVGVYHWVAVETLRVFGVDAAPALAFAFANHALGYGTVLTVGALLFVVGLARQSYTVSDLWRLRREAAPAPLKGHA